MNKLGRKERFTKQTIEAYMPKCRCLCSCVPTRGISTSLKATERFDVNDANLNYPNM